LLLGQTAAILDFYVGHNFWSDWELSNQMKNWQRKLDCNTAASVIASDWRPHPGKD